MYVIRNVSKVGLGQGNARRSKEKRDGMHLALHSRLVEHGTGKNKCC